MGPRQAVVILSVMLMACSGPQRDSTATFLAEASAPRVVRNVIYGHKAGMALTLDVIRPSVPNGAAVLFMNSSGFNSPYYEYLTEDGSGYRLRTDEELAERSLGWQQFNPRLLLENGFTVFDIRHGSSPKFNVPEIVADVRGAVRFVHDNAEEYGIDPDRIGLWGGSAGGYLSLLIGMTAEPGSRDGSDDLARAGGRIAAVVGYYPPTDWERLIAAFPELVAERPALRFPPEQYRELSPVHFATPDDPPTLIIHGDSDASIPLAHGEAVHRALLDAGVTTELSVIKGAGHSFRHGAAELALAETLSWFQRHLLKN